MATATSDGDPAEYVEIIEPESQQVVYVHTVSGKILFAPPEHAKIKPMSQNQWWELLDASSNCYYYHNPHTSETVWERPDSTGGADIISLTKLQDEAETEGGEEVDAAGENGVTTETQQKESKGGQEQPALPKATKAATPVLNRVPSQDIFGSPLDTLSPLNVEYNGHRFSAFEADVEAAEQRRKVSQNELIPASKHKSPRSSRYTDSGKHSKKAQTLARHSKVEDEVRRSQGYKGQSVGKREEEITTSKSHEFLKSAQEKSLPIVKSTQEKSPPIVKSTQEKSPPIVKSTQEKSPPIVKSTQEKSPPIVKSTQEKSPPIVKSTQEKSPPIVKSTHEKPPPAPKTSQEKSQPAKKSAEEKRIESFCMVSVSEAPNPERGLHERKSRSTKTRPAPPVPSLPGTSATLNSSIRKSQNRSSYAGRAPVPPTPPPLPGSIPRSVSMQIRPDRPIEPLDRFSDLSQHKKGLFRRKVTIANMLAWTKDPIKQPMIQTRDKQLKKEAVDMFKLVLQYMGDRKTKIRDVDEIALLITSQAWEKKGLRDEVYIQLCRQTTGNHKSESIRRGWELFTICLAFFPPSIKFRSYLEGYLWRHVDANPDTNKSVPVEVYAQHCHKRVEKMTQSGAKKGVKKPTVEEIKHAKNNPFYLSVFGTTLEEAMEMQVDKHPDMSVPWVVKELFETVLRLQGPQTEGIFRVPGDIDEVNALKLHMDKGNVPPSHLNDPNVPASLLKLWFRELEDPLIPENYYQSCIDNCTHEGNAVSILESLPELNKRILMKLLGFLQNFISPESIKVTRMSAENIAMVWAPNILRCPSEDHMLIFENTRKEMAFLRILLIHHDSSAS